VQRREQSLGESAVGLLVRLGHRVQGLGTLQDVPLDGVLVALPVARVRDTLLAGERRDRPVLADDADLPRLGLVVVRGQLLDGLGGVVALPEQVQAVGAVRDVRVALGRDRARVRARPRHDATDADELRVHGDPHRILLGVPRDDGERCRSWLGHACGDGRRLQKRPPRGSPGGTGRRLDGGPAGSLTIA
jgi:hypothetical protein